MTSPCPVYLFILFLVITLLRLGQKRANALGFVLAAIGLLGLPGTVVATEHHTTGMWVGMVMSYLVFGTGYMMLACILTSLISTHSR